MNLEDIISKMTTIYLKRVVNSILRDVKIDDESEMRQAIVRNILEFKNEERVKTNLDFLEADRNIEVLNELIIICLLEAPGYIATSSDLMAAVERLEQRIVADSEDEQYINSAIPEFAGRVYSTVLTAAWKKDDSLNAHEKNVLEVLRTELGLTRRHHRLLESRIGRFPKRKNEYHSQTQISNALKDLQVRGIVLRFRTDAEYFVIPEEIVRIVRYEKGREVKAAGYDAILHRLRAEQLKVVLSDNGLQSSGNKATLIERIQRFDILPSRALSCLSSEELTEVLRAIDGARVSGSKESKISNIIDHFETDVTPETSDPTDDRAIYYDAFEALARRDYKLLRNRGVIKKDIDVDNLFEKATRYLVEKKLSIPVMEMSGNAHPDGRLKLNGKEVLLWDNKSTEASYYFPDEHVQQFLGYIRAETMRPTVFLVIVQAYTSDAVSQAQKLKALSDTDTDVALITAADLKYVAENWRSFSGMKEPKFNLQLFNLTGDLSRKVLKERMSGLLN